MLTSTSPYFEKSIYFHLMKKKIDDSRLLDRYIEERKERLKKEKKLNWGRGEGRATEKETACGISGNRRARPSRRTNQLWLVSVVDPASRAWKSTWKVHLLRGDWPVSIHCEHLSAWRMIAIGEGGEASARTCSVCFPAHWIRSSTGGRQLAIFLKGEGFWDTIDSGVCVCLFVLSSRALLKQKTYISGKSTHASESYLKVESDSKCWCFGLCMSQCVCVCVILLVRASSVWVSLHVSLIHGRYSFYNVNLHN